MNALAAALDERKDAIARRAMAEMYRDDPFWEARFGERGRKHSLQDGVYHLQYLREAVLGDDPTVLVNYARWLRGVLVPRGMCTAHLVDNLRRIARIVAEDKLPDAAKVQKLVEVAVAALAYDDAALRALQEVRGELKVLAQYLADAVAAENPALFAAHVAWAKPPDAHLAQLERMAPEGILRNAVRAARGAR